MKKSKIIISLLTAAALLLMIPGMEKLQVSATEPVTYSLKYVDSAQDWRFQVGAWDDNANTGSMYYLKESIKDGDLIVIESGDQPLNLELPVNLNNVTFHQAYNAVIKAKSVENVYVLRDSVGIVNGDVVNAYVYDNAVANFNNNVTNLYITNVICGEQTIAVAGTVAYVRIGDSEKVFNEYYNFQTNSFRQEKGSLRTDAGMYSTTPSANTQPASPAAPAAPAAGNEYDDVPKTGEPYPLPCLLIVAAGICFGSAYLLRRKKV